jgi:hypothetical protein
MIPVDVPSDLRERKIHLLPEHRHRVHPGVDHIALPASTLEIPKRDAEHGARLLKNAIDVVLPASEFQYERIGYANITLLIFIHVCCLK